MKSVLQTLAAVGLLVVGGFPAGPGALPSMAQEVDLDVVFRCAATDDAEIAKCGEARDLVLTNCTICHTFVPIVMQQWTEPEWRGLLDRHVGNGRVDQLSKEQVATIHDYLAANFNATLPPPDLPPELLENWTSY